VPIAKLLQGSRHTEVNTGGRQFANRKKGKMDPNNPLSSSYLADVLIEDDMRAVNKLFGPQAE
jgi:hypothetical protein